MRLLRIVLFLVVLGLSTFLTPKPASGSPESIRAGLAGRSSVLVWAIPNAKVYHCRQSQWYGQGQGRVMEECEAIRDGYRAAFGQPCGSKCLSAASGR